MMMPSFKVVEKLANFKPNCTPVLWLRAKGPPAVAHPRILEMAATFRACPREATEKSHLFRFVIPVLIRPRTLLPCCLFCGVAKDFAVSLLSPCRRHRRRYPFLRKMHYDKTLQGSG